MGKYGFRIRFRFEDGVTLDDPGVERQIHPGDHAGLALHSAHTDRPINKSQWLVLRGAGFVSVVAAQTQGEIAKDALRWYGAIRRVGVDVGSDRPIGRFTDAGRCWLGSLFGVPDDTAILDDVHGLCVYPENSSPRFASSSVTPNLLKNASAFMADVSAAVQVGRRFSEELALAFDLFATSRFLRSPRAQFLMLWSAVERLACVQAGDRIRRSATAQAHLDELIALTRASSLPECEKESLSGGLNWLKHESIARLCRALAKQRLSAERYGGRSAVTFIGEAYRLRSSIIHRGQSSDGEVAQACSALEALVCRLLADMGQSGPGLITP